MKRCTPFALRVSALILSACGFLPSVRAELAVKPDDSWVMAGDSITAQCGYSVFLEEYLRVCQGVPGLKAVNFGVGGTTSPFLADRLSKPDIVSYKPSLVTACYGMNDGKYQPASAENEEVYRQGYASAVEKLKAMGVRTIVVGGPGCVDFAFFKRPGVTPAEYNETLRRLSEIARRIAQENGLIFADVHQTMRDAMKKAQESGGQFFAGGDGVHPSPNAHLAMAYAFLKALGVNGNIGTLTVNLAARKAEATEGHKITAFQNGKVTVESSRYPFCFVGDMNPAKILPYLPFNEDFNRYLLVVKGLRTPRAAVTWGKTTKEFSAADLAKGINLAAEFPENPFCEPFLRVQDAVNIKQKFEMFFTAELMRTTERLKGQRPEDAPQLEQILKAGREMDAQLAQLVANRFVPVSHSITINPIP